MLTNLSIVWMLIRSVAQSRRRTLYVRGVEVEAYLGEHLSGIPGGLEHREEGPKREFAFTEAEIPDARASGICFHYSPTDT